MRWMGIGLKAVTLGRIEPLFAVCPLAAKVTALQARRA